MRAGTPGSHQNRGWEKFTDAVVQCLAADKEGMVFMLWGSYAQHKGEVIDENRHLVLRSPHPSPFAAHRGFFGNGHFRRANEYLISRGESPINW